MRAPAPPPPTLSAADVSKFGGAFRLTAALPGFFRQRVDLRRVGDDVRHLVDGRADRFLDLARTQIYARADSPYRILLAYAGCELADHHWAPRPLFNVGNRDYATLTTRKCGCPLHAAGFSLHVHSVRSFEKLTSEGMNYFGADLVTLLEVTLPAEFGGGVGAYQLMEEADPDGQTRVILLVHPSAGSLDHDRVLARLRAGLAAGSRNYQFMTSVCATAGTFRIRREPPRQSKRGKVMALHLRR